MPLGLHHKKQKRISRIMRLLGSGFLSAVPVTYRRNQLVLYADGPAFFPALFRAIRAAQHTLLLEYYLIRDDQTGTTLAEELAAAVQRGVRVMLIYDYVGCVETPAAYFKSLAQQGVELVAFNAPSFKRGIRWFDRRDHRKMTIIDGCLAFLGGFNIGDEYAGIVAEPRRFRDIGFSIRGNAIKDLISIFCESWQMERGEKPQLSPITDLTCINRHRGHANVLFVSGGPHHRSSYIRSAFLVNIASASEELLIVNPYFVPGPRIIRSLLRAARRGVRVRLLLPARSDVHPVLVVGRSSYAALLKGGIEIYEVEREILHAKVMLVDGERTVIGSANLDQRSFHRNFEINGIIDSKQFCSQISAVLEQDLKASTRITLEGHERRGITTRLLERVFNLVSWFL